MKLRVLAFALAILAFFLFVGSPFQQSANAVAIVDDAIIAIVIAALAAFGITFTYTGGYYTLYDFIAECIAESGVNLDGLNVGVNSISDLLLSNRFVQDLQIISTYIATKYNFQSNSNIQIYSSQAGCRDELTGNYYIPGTRTNGSVYTMGTVMFSYQVQNLAGQTQSWTYRFDGMYYKFTVTHSGNNDALLTLYQSEDLTEWKQLQTQYNSGTRNAINICLLEDGGKIYLYMHVVENDWANAFKIVELSDVSVGDDLIANVGVLDIPSDSEIGDNYGILSLPVPWGESYQIIIDSIPVLSDNDQLRGNTTMTLDSDTVVEGQIDSQLTNQPYVGTNPQDYTVSGLTSVFPFCIPFDLYNFVNCLAADPVAPSFTWRFYVPGICDESIEIDLSEFDAAAQILRTMELLLFCVGLAFVTRKIIRG